MLIVHNLNQKQPKKNHKHKKNPTQKSREKIHNVQTKKKTEKIHPNTNKKKNPESQHLHKRPFSS